MLFTLYRVLDYFTVMLSVIILNAHMSKDSMARNNFFLIVKFNFQFIFRLNEQTLKADLHLRN